MKRNPAGQPRHQNGKRIPPWVLAPVWSRANFSLWGRGGLSRKVNQRLNRQERAALREARLPAMQRFIKSIRRVLGGRGV